MIVWGCAGFVQAFRSQPEPPAAIGTPKDPIYRPAILPLVSTQIPGTMFVHHQGLMVGL